MKTILTLLLLLFLPALLPAQSLRGDFEQWDTTSFTRPWTDVDAPYIGVLPRGWRPGGYYGVGRSPDARTGSWSASIWNWYGSIPGVLVLGGQPVSDQGRGLIHDGIAIDEVPAKLTGSYKYLRGSTYSVDDSARVLILLKRFDPELDRADTVAFLQTSLGPAESWTSFEIPIPTPRAGMRPDSIAIAFYSSYMGSCKEARCCNLLLDDLFLSTAAGVPFHVEDGHLVSASVTPNPLRVSSIISFAGAAEGLHRVSIIDGAGHVVRTVEAAGTRIELRRDDLAAGSYLFVVSDASGATVATGRLMVGEK